MEIEQKLVLRDHHENKCDFIASIYQFSNLNVGFISEVR